MAAEPWLRGTLPELDAVRRQVLHALELTWEDAERWCGGLNDAEIHERAYGLASVAFHLRHIARSLDRLLTYAEGKALSDAQHEQLRVEMDMNATAAEILAELHAGLCTAGLRIRAIQPSAYDDPRGVGRAMLPSTVGGLLIHCAEHTQRHTGQAITVSKVVLAMRNARV